MLKSKQLVSKRFAFSGSLPSSLKARAAEARRSVVGKISTGVYKFEDVACFCSAEDGILIAERDRYGLYYPVVVCRNCGIMRANPRMTENSFADFYRHEYRALYGDNSVDKEELFQKSLKKGEELFCFLRNSIDIDSIETVCDIGCYMGAMLIPFNKIGKKVYGTDYDESYLSYGRKITGIDNLFFGGAERLIQEDVKADLIIVNHVLEHFVNIEKELKKIKKIMKPKAYIFVEVPGTFWWIKNICCGNIMDLFQSAHTYQFSLESLKYVMECNGFELVFGNEEARAVFKNSRYVRSKEDVSKNETRKVLNYLKKVETIYWIKKSLLRIIEALGLKDIVKELMGKKVA